MGLVQNLKRKLGGWAEKILVELSYHYIIQRAKQTTRRPDNSLPTECLQNNLTTGHQSITIATSSQDTSVKTTMELNETEQTIVNARNWSVARIDETKPVADKNAIYKEFEEWIEIDNDTESIDILSLEPLDGYYQDN